MMKKIKQVFLTIVLLLVTAPAFAAPADETPSPELLSFRSEIMSYLRTEGYAPYIDEDNDLCFKKEGELYWFDLALKDPFYVELHRSGFTVEGTNKALLLMAANEVNLNRRCVKASMGEKSVSFTIEMFCKNAAQFTSVFKRCMSALDDGYEFMKDYYNKNDE